MKEGIGVIFFERLNVRMRQKSCWGLIYDQNEGIFRWIFQREFRWHQIFDMFALYALDE
jgi:hypothetical protein